MPKCNFYLPKLGSHPPKAVELSPKGRFHLEVHAHAQKLLEIKPIFFQHNHHDRH